MGKSKKEEVFDINTCISKKDKKKLDKLYLDIEYNKARFPQYDINDSKEFANVEDIKKNIDQLTLELKEKWENP